jgi:hypothetical protein
VEPYTRSHDEVSEPSSCDRASHLPRLSPLSRRRGPDHRGPSKHCGLRVIRVLVNPIIDASRVIESNRRAGSRSMITGNHEVTGLGDPARHEPSMAEVIRWRTWASPAPLIRTRFRLLLAPETIIMSRGGAPRREARIATTARFAPPSRGRGVTAILSASPWSPTIPARRAPGCTWTVRMTPSLTVEMSSSSMICRDETLRSIRTVGQTRALPGRPFGPSPLTWDTPYSNTNPSAARDWRRLSAVDGVTEMVRIPPPPCSPCLSWKSLTLAPLASSA